MVYILQLHLKVDLIVNVADHESHMSEKACCMLGNARTAMSLSQHWYGMWLTIKCIAAAAERCVRDLLQQQLRHDP